MSRSARCRQRIAAALLLAAASSGLAHAGSCTVSSTGLAFGPYQPLTFAGAMSSAAATSSATISLVCNGIVNGGPYTIALGPSAAGGGDGISTRYLSKANGGANMAFNVYREPTYATIWGDGVAGGYLIGGTLASGDSNQSHTVYGRIAAGQNTLGPGSYAALLTITLSWSP